LLVIGGSLVGQMARDLWRDISLILVGKLLLHPLAVLLLVMLLPPMGRELQVAVVMLAAVPQMGIYPILAQRFGHDGMAASAQLVSTVVSFFTLTGLLWVLAPPV
jgi:predicted permease